MEKYYHVTLAENVESILANGLEPRIGRLAKLVDDEKAVYLFASENDFIENVSNWMWHYFKEDDELTALEITLPADFSITKRNEWEVTTRSTIPPNYITVFCKV